jgi:hypothetical protein
MLSTSDVVRFQVLTAAIKKMTAFWVITPCSLVEVDWRFRGAYCLHLQGLMEAFKLAGVSRSRSISCNGNIGLFKSSY